MSDITATPEVEEAPPVTPTSIGELEPKMKLKGVVKRLELYGAFIDVGVGVDGLIHISKLGTEHVNRVADVLNEGDEVTVWVDKVDPSRNQLMLTMIEPLAVDWKDLKDGQIYNGTVTRLETFGAFVNIGAEREGLVHISELSHGYINNPSEVVSVGDEVRVEVLGFNRRKRRIDLSVKALLEKPEQEQSNEYAGNVQDYQVEIEEEEEDLEMPNAMEIAFRRAMGDDVPRSERKRKPSKKRRRDREKYRRQQDDLLSRTLQGE
ncbi:MAG: S1 RNA-binding domain-containing protein [Anaerolineae bacterium]|nr:S1 RNA-binding domain-containing protein [Anaerolineae bacterium]